MENQTTNKPSRRYRNLMKRLQKQQMGGFKKQFIVDKETGKIKTIYHRP